MLDTYFMQFKFFHDDPADYRSTSEYVAEIMRSTNEWFETTPDLTDSTKQHPENIGGITWNSQFDLIKDYFFNSDEKFVAWLLLIGAFLCALTLVGFFFVFSWWFSELWNILAIKAFDPFIYCIQQLGVILATYTSVILLKDYFVGKLSISWREWLTKRIVSELFKNNNFLEVKRHGKDIDNVAQRIQEDISTFVSLSLSLGIGAVYSTVTLGAFLYSLWVVGGALSFTLFGLNIIIPGYMVWLSLIFGLASTGLAHYLGQSLPETNKLSELTEAEFRQLLEQLNDKAENIAQEHAQDYYQVRIQDYVNRVVNTSNNKMKTTVKLNTFENFYMQLCQPLPFILAAPLYYAARITFDELAQIGFAFSQVSTALGWFITAYEEYSDHQASTQRLLELQKLFNKENLKINEQAIVRKVRDKENINIKHLTIKQPQQSSTECILKNFSLKMTPGEHVLIKGKSGLGKSTLFKVLADTWKYGDGKISLPSNKFLYFLPQEATLPNDTLRAVLAYPEPAKTYTTEQYITALKLVGLDHLIEDLDASKNWTGELSGGQKQRLPLVRALLKKPDWLFLDEITSSLDNDNEERIYKILKSELKNTTLVSIGHRDSLVQYHDRVIDLGNMGR